MMFTSLIAIAAATLDQPRRQAAPPPPPTVYFVPMPPAPVPPPSPPSLPDASPAARTLVQQILTQIPPLEQMVRRDLLRSIHYPNRDRPGCDLANTECAQILNEILDRETPALLRQDIEMASRILGAHFDATMSPEQIAATTAFVDSPAGQAFVASMIHWQDFNVRQLENLERLNRTRSHALADEFERRGAGLPRAATAFSPVPPPPPPPPPPAPRR